MLIILRLIMQRKRGVQILKLCFFMSIVMPLSSAIAEPNKLESFVEAEAKEGAILLYF
jgi:hypothetical protein